MRRIKFFKKTLCLAIVFIMIFQTIEVNAMTTYNDTDYIYKDFRLLLPEDFSEDFDGDFSELLPEIEQHILGYLNQPIPIQGMSRQTSRFPSNANFYSVGDGATNDVLRRALRNNIPGTNQSPLSLWSQVAFRVLDTNFGYAVRIGPQHNHHGGNAFRSIWTRHNQPGYGDFVYDMQRVNYNFRRRGNHSTYATGLRQYNNLNEIRLAMANYVIGNIRGGIPNLTATAAALLNESEHRFSSQNYVRTLGLLYNRNPSGPIFSSIITSVEDRGQPHMMPRYRMLDYNSFALVFYNFRFITTDEFIHEGFRNLQREIVNINNVPGNRQIVRNLYEPNNTNNIMSFNITHREGGSASVSNTVSHSRSFQHQVTVGLRYEFELDLILGGIHRAEVTASYSYTDITTDTTSRAIYQSTNYSTDISRSVHISPGYRLLGYEFVDRTALDIQYNVPAAIDFSVAIASLSGTLLINPYGNVNWNARGTEQRHFAMVIGDGVNNTPFGATTALAEGGYRAFATRRYRQGGNAAARNSRRYHFNLANAMSRTAQSSRLPIMGGQQTINTLRTNIPRGETGMIHRISTTNRGINVRTEAMNGNTTVNDPRFDGTTVNLVTALNRTSAVHLNTGNPTVVHLWGPNNNTDRARWLFRLDPATNTYTIESLDSRFRGQFLTENTGSGLWRALGFTNTLSNSARWIVAVNGNDFHIINYDSGRLLDVALDSAANGASVRSHNVRGGATGQRWLINIVARNMLPLGAQYLEEDEDLLYYQPEIEDQYPQYDQEPPYNQPKYESQYLNNEQKTPNEQPKSESQYVEDEHTLLYY